MKTKKFLATILIVSSVFLGTGYAWWTEGVEVASVVSTGKFKVVGVQSKLSYETITGSGSEAGKVIAENYTEQQEVKHITYDIKDLFPKKNYYFEAEFKNVGSIPAVVGAIEIRFNKNNEDKTKENIKIEGSIETVEDKKSLETRPIKTTVKNLEKDLNKILKDLRIEPGQSLILKECRVYLGEDVYDNNKKKNKHEGESITFELEILFKQHNQK